MVPSRASRSLRAPIVRAAALLAALGPTLPLHAEIPDDAMSIELRVEPVWTLPGGRVTLSGTTVADGRRMTVTLRIAEPDSALVERPAAVTAGDGAYQVVLERLTKPGLYQVTAIAPDGRGRADGTFRVLAPAAALEEVAGVWAETVEDANHAVERATVDTAELPPSPARAEAEEKLGELRREMAKRGEDVAKLRGVLESIGDLPKHRPEAAPLFAPLLDSLGAWSRDTESRRVTINQKLLDSARHGEVCETIHTAGEGIKMASALLNLAGGALDIAISFFRDASSAAAQEGPRGVARSDPASRFAVGEVVKNAQTSLEALTLRYVGRVEGAGPGVTREMAGWKAGGVLGAICTDLVGVFTDAMFDRFCEKLEGPFSASLHVEFSNESGSVWWKYDIRIAGRLQLRYAREETRQALRVRGEFIGSADEFGLWENVLETLDPALMRGHVLWKKNRLPTTIPFVPTEGDYLGATLGPGAFFIPVEGDLVGDRIALRVLAPKVDFSHLQAASTYVIAGVRTMGFPVVVEVPFPYKGAHFVITRSADAKDGPFDLPVTVDRKAGRTVAERTFSRPRVAGDGNVADYSMRIRICSPGC